MSDNSISGFSSASVAPSLAGSNNKNRPGSWFEAMAHAWGQVLDAQAVKITELSDQIGPGGEDKPSVMAQLTAESLRMNFMANSESTSVDSVGRALETMARKN
ncbi:hypothetical protein CFHF_06660 [Caulobacter flavus]|uniref:Serine kinase n=1 Tax=Caulobacter flavus TaxID=1679497 RepID=A0A2N5CX77_9CAUL|nr:hypothetical protein [Caulobacter flavus]AYV47579.1 hypothetical protein C1707_15660 [Caulobacter flavus]PLR18420.1 hypothetical protein CFHF_06660 [Caulobacter flavus]